MSNTNMKHWYSLFGALQVKNDQLSVGNLKDKNESFSNMTASCMITIIKYLYKSTFLKQPYVYKTHILKLLSSYSLQTLFLQHKQPPGKKQE